nr:hypothetical protein [Spiroplasma melliferum]
MQRILLFLGILLSLFISNSNLIIIYDHNIKNERNSVQKQTLSTELINGRKTIEPPKIPLSLPFKIFASPFIFANLFNMVSKNLLLDKNIINNINLKTVGTLEFTNKYNKIINTFDDAFYPLLKKHFLDINADFKYELTESLSIIGKGTIRDIFHNIAPDLIAFLQWYTNNAYEQVLAKHSIFLSFYNSVLKPFNLNLNLIPSHLWSDLESYVLNNYEQVMGNHNMVLLFLQYLLSPVNYDLKEIIGKEYGTETDCWFYHHTKTNFDSLVFHLLSGYQNKLNSNNNNNNNNNKYVLKLIGNLKISFLFYLQLDEVVDQNLIGEQAELSMWNLKSYVSLKLEPTLLLASMLDIFSQGNEKAFDVITNNLLSPKTWKGINPNVVSSISTFSVFFGSIIMHVMEMDILYHLKINEHIIKNSEVEMISGTVQLMFKNQSGRWEKLKPTIQNDVFYLSQILVAVDFKFSFKDVEFKVIVKDEPNIFYKINKKFNFDLRLSKEI